jgi:Protein of unknown function (DUF3775)
MDMTPELVSAIIEHARAYDAKEPTTDPDSGSNPVDDRDLDILQETPGDLTGEDLRSVIEALNVDQAAELVALMWIGRGEYEGSEWPHVVKRARERATGPTSRYLMGVPMLGDYLQDGLEAVMNAGVRDQA